MGAGSYSEYVTISKSGTADSRLVMESYPGSVVGGFLITGAYVRVAGFRISGVGAPLYSGGVEIRGSEVALRGLTITNLAADIYGVLVQFDSVRNLTIDGCRFGNCNYPHVSLLGSGHLITNSVWTGVTGWDAIRLLCSNSRVVGNAFVDFSGSAQTYSITHGDIIQAFSDNGETSTNNVIERNLIKNTPYIQICNVDDVSLGRVGAWTWRNNIFIGPSMQGNLYTAEFPLVQQSVLTGLPARVGRFCGSRETALKTARGGKVVNNVFVE